MKRIAPRHWSPHGRAPTVVVRGSLVTVSGDILTNCQDVFANGKPLQPAPLPPQRCPSGQDLRANPPG